MPHVVGPVSACLFWVLVRVYVGFFEVLTKDGVSQAEVGAHTTAEGIIQVGNVTVAPASAYIFEAPISSTLLLAAKESQQDRRSYRATFCHEDIALGVCRSFVYADRSKADGVRRINGRREWCCYSRRLVTTISLTKDSTGGGRRTADYLFTAWGRGRNPDWRHA